MLALSCGHLGLYNLSRTGKVSVTKQCYESAHSSGRSGLNPLMTTTMIVADTQTQGTTENIFKILWFSVLGYALVQ